MLCAVCCVLCVCLGISARLKRFKHGRQRRAAAIEKECEVMGQHKQQQQNNNNRTTTTEQQQNVLSHKFLKTHTHTHTTKRGGPGHENLLRHNTPFAIACFVPVHARVSCFQSIAAIGGSCCIWVEPHCFSLCVCVFVCLLGCSFFFCVFVGVV